MALMVFAYLKQKSSSGHQGIQLQTGKHPVKGKEKDISTN